MPTLIQNKKVHLDYEILKEFEAGIELLGLEVKSLKLKRGSLKGSFVTLRSDGAYLSGAQIPPYQVGNTPKEYDPYRDRRLLLTKEEARELTGIERMKGLTIAPISMYTKVNKIKVRIGIARGKKKYDKRETLKKKAARRDIEKEMKKHARG
jgi:SsrA-binding protein